MDEAIRGSERMVAVLSPDYLGAFFTHPEWAAAFAQDPTGYKGVLLPVRVRECDLTGLLNQVIYVDLVGKGEAEAKKTLLCGILRERAKPLIKPEFPKDIPRLVSEHPSFPGAVTKKLPVKTLTALTVLCALVIAGLIAYRARLFTSLLEPPRPCPKLAAGNARYYEAEEAELSGGASKDSEHTGFSGDGFVSGYGVAPEAATTFWVDVPSDGQYQVDLCYANSTNSAKVLTIFVNEEALKQTHLPNASRWDIWLTQTESLPLRAGHNSISYRKTSRDNGQVNVDFIGVRESGAAASQQPASTSNVSLSGVVVDQDERPLQGAKVTIEELPDVPPVETTSKGQFNLEYLPLKVGDRVMLHVVLDGYKPNPHREDVVIGNYASEVHLTKEQ
jgi:hypothetical protein